MKAGIPSTLLIVGLAAILLGLGPAASAEAARSPVVTFYFGLDRPEGRAAAAYSAASDPSSAGYRNFRSRRRVRRQFGASRRTVKRLRRSAARHGLRVKVDPSRVFARVSARVRRFQRVFRVRIRRFYNDDLHSYGWAIRGHRRPRLPRAMRSAVRETVFSFNRSIVRKGKGKRRGKAGSGRPGRQTRAGTSGSRGIPEKTRPANAGTWIGGCDAARETGAYAPAQVRRAYGLGEATSGRGASVAIMNAGEGLTAFDIKAAAKCFGQAALKSRTLLTDGQKRPFGRATFEPQEDLALVRGMAPKLESVTFSQAWLSPELWFLSPADIFARGPLPDSFTISYGECERQIRGRAAPPAARGGARLFDSLLIRLGLAGVGSYAASGDFGSTCDGQPFSGVTWPASSAFLTAVGGTRLVLDANNERVDEVAWNDLAWLPAGNGGGAGGGGFSIVSARPDFQSALKVPGRRRIVPDVAAHASMLPGWPVNLGVNWIEDGGTSASAPLVAAAMAAISGNERSAGRPPLGPVNGLLYSMASGGIEPTFDVVSGNNRFKAKVPARRARRGYDPVTGLGVPRFDRVRAAAAALSP